MCTIFNKGFVSAKEYLKSYFYIKIFLKKGCDPKIDSSMFYISFCKSLAKTGSRVALHQKPLNTDEIIQEFRGGVMQRRRSIVVLLFLLTLILLPCVSKCKELRLIIVDEDIDVIDEIYEGETFLIYVTDKDDPSQPLDNYTIIFDGKSYYFSKSDPNYPFCYLTAPQVDSDKKMQIVVKKEGYEDGYAEITVKNKPRLIVYPSSFSVKSGEDITIEVKDEDGNPVEDAYVYLVVGKKKLSLETNANGIAILTAPEVDEKTSAYIEISKEGYEDARIEGYILPLKTSFINDFIDKNLLVTLGIAISIIFFFAGIIRYVRRREEIHESLVDETVGVDTSSGEEMERKVEDHRPKIEIEEIEIGRPERKVAKKVKSKKPEVTPISFRPTKLETEPDTWVVGRDSIIEKIDEKIGKAEGKKRDLSKWLTGKEDIAAKVDEKIKEIERKKRSNSP